LRRSPGRPKGFSIFLEKQLMETFDDLLAASKQQDQPQRLLLVFAVAELPDNASAAQRAAFERGEGGHLNPTVCVDRLPAEISSFATLRAEAAGIAGHWDMLFVTAMAGRGGHAPNADEAVQPLRMMVEQVRTGRLARFLAVRPDGQLTALEAVD
jgi:hypothetical protein